MNETRSCQTAIVVRFRTKFSIVRASFVADIALVVSNMY